MSTAIDVDRDRISISLGSLDDPHSIAPARQYGIEGRLPFLANLVGLPGSRTEDAVPAQGWRTLAKPAASRSSLSRPPLPPYRFQWRRLRGYSAGCRKNERGGLRMMHRSGAT
jgi:hypothetical protein